MASAALCSAALAAVAPAARAPRHLRLDVAEWSVVPSDGAVRAGAVVLTVRNFGTEAHELRVVRTARWGQTLSAKMRLSRSATVGDPLLVAPGRTRSETVTLPRGSYVVLDDLPGHYAAGAWVAILVL